jgi:hypothetical protein
MKLQFPAWPEWYTVEAMKDPDWPKISSRFRRENLRTHIEEGGQMDFGYYYTPGGKKKYPALWVLIPEGPDRADTGLCAGIIRLGKDVWAIRTQHVTPIRKLTMRFPSYEAAVCAFKLGAWRE